MDILYIMGEGYSKCNYNELRYSLRSIEKYGKNVDRVFVAGYCPEWLSDEVIKVPMQQPYPKANVTEKHINFISVLYYVIDNTDIGDDFLVSMDDHFYIRDVDFNNYPVYAKIVGGESILKTIKNPPSRYGRFILSTRDLLQSYNLPINYFTLHRNMHVYRDTLNLCREIFKRISEEKLDCEPIVFLLNYRYNLKPFKYVEVKDVKIKTPESWFKVNSNITEVFSTYDFESDSKLDNLIAELYPNKSKYEK